MVEEIKVQKRVSRLLSGAEKKPPQDFLKLAVRFLNIFVIREVKKSLHFFLLGCKNVLGQDQERNNYDLTTEVRRQYT